jgi:pimeloyl-ACP methyl ester carboxylesterase
MRAVPRHVFEVQADALDTRRNMVEAVAPFPGPVEIAVGAEDRICPPRLHAPLAARLGDVRLTEIPGTGHLASVEAPVTVTALLMRLIARARA